MDLAVVAVNVGRTAATVAGIVLVLGIFWEAFETIVLPRTVSRRLRFTTLFYEVVWRVGYRLVRILRNHNSKREYALSVLGPLSLILLIASWSIAIIFGYALLQLGLNAPLSGGDADFGQRLYFSAATFFTVGYGDVVATAGAGKLLSVVEAGMGFGMFALVISYFPVLYQAFSARERVSLLLDARAGSPPVAAELLETYADDLEGLRELFVEFERWGASLLETYLSYPILTVYRSQHEELSWIASTTCICDACALVQVAYLGDSKEMNRLQRQSKLTYAMLRHLVVDIAYVIDEDPVTSPDERLTLEGWIRISSLLTKAGAPVCLGQESCDRLTEMRADYEPYLLGLANGLFLTVPPWMRLEHQLASWETTAWDDGKHF